VKVATLIIVAFAGMIIGAWLQSKFSPAPSVVDTPVARPNALVSVADIQLAEPSKDGEAYRLQATLNRDGPPGVVDVAFRLRNRTTGERIEQSGSVELEPGVALVVVAEMTAPRADYTPEVEVKGPAR
jgi:hypothetical protein